MFRLRITGRSSVFPSWTAEKKREGKVKNNNRMSRNKSEVFKKALDDMCKGLNKFGPKEILNLMVIHSHQDDVVHHLLARFPMVVALGDFLSTLPIWKVNKRTLKRLQKSGCVV